MTHCQLASRPAPVDPRESLSRAAVKLGVQRGEMMEHIARRPALQTFVADIRDMLFDDAEENLRYAVSLRIPWAVRRVLRTLGADRGYGPHPNPAVTAESPQPNTMPAGNANSQPAVAATPAPATPAATVTPNAVPTNEKVREALIRAQWHLNRAAGILNLGRSALTLIIAGRPALLSLAVDQRETAVDDAETALRLAMHDRQRWEVEFAIATLGRNKGYGSRLSKRNLHRVKCFENGQTRG
jgi:hypothetical protein